MRANYNLTELDSEFRLLSNSFTALHQDQRSNVDYYKRNVFYSPKEGRPREDSSIGANLLRALVDKKVNYLAQLHSVKVPPPGMDQGARELASQNEKIIYAAYEENNFEAMHAYLAFCTTVMREAFVRSDFDVRRRAYVPTALDPRFCYYQFADENTRDEITVFYYAVSMTRDQIRAKFGIDPQHIPEGGTTDGIDGSFIPLDGTDRWLVIHRWDDQVRCAWIGNRFIETPHRHGWDCVPIDRVAPLYDGDSERKGGSFMEPLLALQAEFNDVLRRKVNVIRRMGNPPVWAKGLKSGQGNDIKQALKGEGGLVSLQRDGELGLLQLNETSLYDAHLQGLFQNMKDIAGFPTATFGEVMGANTSGDALNMYFQPTAQALAKDWIGYKSLYKSLNAKILKSYELFGLEGEQFELTGRGPKGTFESPGYGQPRQYGSGGFTVYFTPESIGGYHRSEIVTPQVTPKDEIEFKRLIMDAATSGFLPRVTAYDEWGIVSPEDTLDLLEQEQMNPAFNSDMVNMAPSGEMGSAAPPPSGPGLTPSSQSEPAPV